MASFIKPCATIGDTIIAYKLWKASATPEEISDFVRLHFDGCNTNPASVACTLNKAAKKRNDRRLHTSFKSQVDQRVEFLKPPQVPSFSAYRDTEHKKTTIDVTDILKKNIEKIENDPDPFDMVRKVQNGATVRQLESIDETDVIEQFEAKLRERMIGQNDAIAAVIDQYTLYTAGAVLPNRPVSTMFMLGPTGVGKTLLVESVAYALHEDEKSMIKINCGEYQAEHEISKLIGAPAGYVGHDVTKPRLSQESIDEVQSRRCRVTIILIDEIEKANPTLFKLLLGVLDKGDLTMSNGQRVDMTKCWIFMTSNVAAREIVTLTKSKKTALIDKVAREAMRQKFSPEFIGRIDTITVFGQLADSEFEKILHLEVAKIGETMRIKIELTERAVQEILARVVDKFYGARSMKQGLRTHVTLPIARQKIKGTMTHVKIDWPKKSDGVMLVM